MFERDFPTGSVESQAALRRVVQSVVGLLRGLPGQVYSGQSPAELRKVLACDLDARERASEQQVMDRLAAVAAHSIKVNHPDAIAHLHCQTTIPAIAAELLVAALNPSMDSFDQAPAATIVELEVLRHLCGRTGFPEASGGTFTPGATQSNLFGLLLAREAALETRFGRRGWRDGLGDAGRSLRILCSEAAHFTVEKSAAQLGLGTGAVVRVACDEDFRMSVPALRETAARLGNDGLHAMAIVATAGTTDFGSIDPLEEVAEVARSIGAWFHADAAYGGALLFSDRHRGKLAGMELADSVSIDFHKLLWQPIGCGVFLVRDAAQFERVRMHADYLNPEEHEQDGVPDLVTRSLLTSRRFDALKLWVSLQIPGARELEAMIDHTLALSTGVAGYIRAQERLKLLHEPALGCVVFRYWPAGEAGEADRINAAIRREMFDSGRAVLGQTRVHGRTCLKLTCLNPCTRFEQVRRLVDDVVALGLTLETSGAVAPRQVPAGR